jgi:hypothetical protein
MVYSKWWLIINPRDSDVLEKLIRGMSNYHVSDLHSTTNTITQPTVYCSFLSARFPEQTCKGFVQHKNVFFHPKVLARHKIRFTILEQTAGDILVLFQKSYHMGVSSGDSLCVSVNFAILEWLHDIKNVLKVRTYVLFSLLS